MDSFALSAYNARDRRWPWWSLNCMVPVYPGPLGMTHAGARHTLPTGHVRHEDTSIDTQRCFRFREYQTSRSPEGNNIDQTNSVEAASERGRSSGGPPVVNADEVQMVVGRGGKFLTDESGRSIYRTWYSAPELGTFLRQRSYQ
jgi:hypothetical protein